MMLLKRIGSRYDIIGHPRHPEERNVGREAYAHRFDLLNIGPTFSFRNWHHHVLTTYIGNIIHNGFTLAHLWKYPDEA